MNQANSAKQRFTQFVMQCAGTAIKSGLRGILLLVPLMFVGGFLKGEPEATIREILLESSPQLSEDDIIFEGCEFRVVAEGQNHLGGQVRNTLRIDLRLFVLDPVRIVPTNPSGAVLVAQGTPLNDRLLDQAMRIAELFRPASGTKEAQLTMHNGATVVTENRVQLDAGESIGRERVEQMLDQPTGTLVFRIGSVAIDDEPMKPHEDAPAFFDFAERVRALPAPMTASISLHFKGAEEIGEELMVGTVVLPRALQLKTQSPEQAQELTRALNLYKANSCDTD